MTAGVTYTNDAGLTFTVAPENAVENTESLDQSVVAPLGSHYIVFNVSATNTSDRRGTFDMHDDQFLLLQAATAADVKGCEDYQKQISQGNTVTLGRDCNAPHVTRPQALYTNDGIAGGGQMALSSGGQADLSLEYLLPDDVIQAGGLVLGTSNTEVLAIPAPTKPSP